VADRKITREEVIGKLKAMRDAELKIDDLDILNNTPAFEAAMAAGRAWHEALDQYERDHGHPFR
jgi:hypothetical protein